MINTFGKVVNQLRLPTVNTEGTSVSVISVQEGDFNSRVLEISFYDDIGDIDLSGYSNAILTATSESGESIFASKLCEFSDDGKHVLIEISGELTEKPGRLICDIRLSNDDESKVLTSETFHVIVLESQVGLFIKDNIENCNDLLSAIKEAEKNKIVEQKRVVAEEARIVNENLRIEQENNRVEQERMRIIADANMTANENIRQENERSRITAESGRVYLSERFNKLLQPIDNTMANQVGQAELLIDNSSGKIVAKNLKGEKGDKGEDGTIIKVGNVQKKELGFTSDPQSQINSNREELETLCDNTIKIKEIVEYVLANKQDKYITIFDMNNSQYDLGFPQGIKAGGEPINIDLSAYKKVKIFFKSAACEVTSHIMDIEASANARDNNAFCSKNNASIWFEDNEWRYHNKIATVYYNTVTKKLDYRGAGYLNYVFSNSSFEFNDRSIRGTWSEEYVICKMEGLK